MDQGAGAEWTNLGPYGPGAVWTRIPANIMQNEYHGEQPSNVTADGARRLVIDFYLRRLGLELVATQYDPGNDPG